MIGRLKVLGLTLAAVGTLGVAGGASAAAAADFSSSFTGGKTFLTASEEQEFKFTVNNRTIVCHDISLRGETAGSLGAGTWEGLTLEPTFDGCTAFGLPMTVDLNGCDYSFTASGQRHILCPPGTSMTWTVFGGANHAQAPVCIYHILPQTVGGTTYTNDTVPQKVLTLDLNLTNITIVATGPVLTCGSNGHRPGSLTGSSTVRGYSNAAHTESADLQHVP